MLINLVFRFLIYIFKIFYFFLVKKLKKINKISNYKILVNIFIKNEVKLR